MAKKDLYEMIYQLAERGLGKSVAGEGSQAARAVALLLSAIDNLATAATLDEALFPATQQAIDILRQKVEEQGGGKKKETPSPSDPTKKSPSPTGKEGKEDGSEEEEESQKGGEDG